MSKPRIAVVTQGVKLPGEARGYTRFRKIAEVLVDEGFEVDLVTSTFQHWDKAQRDIGSEQYQGHPYNIVFIEEPGYKKNLDLLRIASHARLAKNMAAHFDEDPARYDLVYCEIPPNDMARECALAAKAAGIPFVADVNDLWPEAMRMALDIPVISDVAYAPFARDAALVYQTLDAVVGTSDEYAARPAQGREEPYPRLTVYVGNNLKEFDAGVAAHAAEVGKPEGEFWVSYAGTLGASYDLDTLVGAAAACAEVLPGLRVKVLGDGPDRARLEALAVELAAPVDFMGYVDYAHMAAWLSKSDATINSLVANAPQSIPTKIGDYLAAGVPLINTGASPELCCKVEAGGLGLNVPAEDIEALSEAIFTLSQNEDVCGLMGRNARNLAENDFDQNRTYRRIAQLIFTLLPAELVESMQG